MGIIKMKFNILVIAALIASTSAIRLAEEPAAVEPAPATAPAPEEEKKEGRTNEEIIKEMQDKKAAQDKDIIKHDDKMAADEVADYERRQKAGIVAHDANEKLMNGFYLKDNLAPGPTANISTKAHADRDASVAGPPKAT